MSMRGRRRRSRRLLRLIVPGFRGIYFLQLISQIADLSLKSFHMFFHFLIELLAPRRQLWEEKHPTCTHDDT
jgi:hypothetical protein